MPWKENVREERHTYMYIHVKLVAGRYSWKPLILGQLEPGGGNPSC